MNNTRKIENIEIVFKNWDAITVGKKELYLFEYEINKKTYNVDSAKIQYHAKIVNMCINMSALTKEEEDRIVKVKDITHILLKFTDGAVEEIEVEYPFYFSYWFCNPYQENYIWNNNGKKMIDIDIRKHISILSIWQSIKDYYVFISFAFPERLFILLDGYIATLKRFFKIRH